MIITVTILIFVVCALLVLLVLIQNSKGGGLASNMGAASQVTQLFGARRGTDFVQQLTWGAMGTLVVLTLVINFLFAYQTSGGGEDNQGPRIGNSLGPVVPPTSIPTAPEGAPAETPAETPGEGEAPAQ